MDSVTQQMLLIKSVDNDATIGFSEYTGKWYVQAKVEVGGDGLLRGMTEHADSPGSAVEALLVAMTEVASDRYLVSGYGPKRRHYRWNGAAFYEAIGTYPSTSD
jgi:hypothetical protein